MSTDLRRASRKFWWSERKVREPAVMSTRTRSSACRVQSYLPAVIVAWLGTTLRARVRSHLAILGATLGATAGDRSIRRRTVVNCLPWSREQAGTVHDRPDLRCGGSGIRTHGGLPHTRFPSVPIRPLSHPSGRLRPAAAGAARGGGTQDPTGYRVAQPVIAGGGRVLCNRSP